MSCSSARQRGNKHDFDGDLERRQTSSRWKSCTKGSEEFASKHGLTGYQVVAIWQNSDDPLFDELDSAITNASIEGLDDRDDFDGYQIAPTD